MMKCRNCSVAGSAEEVLLQRAPGRQGHRHARAGAGQPVRHLGRAAAQRGQVRGSRGFALAGEAEETLAVGGRVWGLKAAQLQ